jgi:hypothetical protein
MFTSLFNGMQLGYTKWSFPSELDMRVDRSKLYGVETMERINIQALFLGTVFSKFENDDFLLLLFFSCSVGSFSLIQSRFFPSTVKTMFCYILCCFFHF